MPGSMVTVPVRIVPDMLRKKSEIGKTSISKRKTISATMMRDVKEMLREYFDIMDVPDDEDGLIRFVTEKFSEQRDYYSSLNLVTFWE